MKVTQEQVLRALATVQDPDLKKDLVSLGMITELSVEGLTARFTVMLTTPACPLKEKIKADCEAAIRTLVGPEVLTEITMSSNVTTRLMDDQLKGVRNVIAVVSGKGGVGKSTIATNLAVALARSGARTALVDCDIYGPSLPILMGMRHQRPQIVMEGERELMVPLLKHGVHCNSIGFLIPEDQALVWRGPMAAKGMKQLLFDTQWGELDYLILDMPPGTGDMHLTLVQQTPVTGVVLVTTPQEVALADARKGARMYLDPQVNVPLLGIVENMAFFVPHDLPDRRYYIFGEKGGQNLAAELQVPLLAQIPLVEKVRLLGDEGQPPALDESTPSGMAFNEMARQVARQVAIRNSDLPPTQKVKIMHS